MYFQILNLERGLCFCCNAKYIVVCNANAILAVLALGRWGFLNFFLRMFEVHSVFVMRNRLCRSCHSISGVSGTSFFVSSPYVLPPVAASYFLMLFVLLFLSTIIFLF